RRDVRVPCVAYDFGAFDFRGFGMRSLVLVANAWHCATLARWAHAGFGPRITSGRRPRARGEARRMSATGATVLPTSRARWPKRLSPRVVAYYRRLEAHPAMTA